VLTNGLTIKQAEKLVRLGLQHAFSPDALFISEEMGVAKPHPRIFQVACERLHVAPADTLYVGDSPRTDIDPAHQAGLRTCWRRGRGKHAAIAGETVPDYVVDSLDELLAALDHEGAVAFGPPRGASTA
jgi:putative hydrolase of the HAD superfamily